MPEMTPLRKIIGEAIPTPPVPKSLVTKLAEVMAAVERIPKRGTNEFHHYAYATEADIVDAVRHELAKRSVMLLPHVRKMTREGTLTTLEMEFVFHDGESSDQLTVQWVGVGEDKSDKGVWKAMTGAVKYCLLKCFLIPTGDDPEAAEHPGQPVARPVKTPRLDMRGVSAAIARGQDTVKVDMRTGEILTPPAQAAVDAGQGDMLLISAAQVKRLWSIARKIGWKDDELKAWLEKDYSIDSTKNIPRAKYDAIMAHIEAGTEAK